MIKELIKTKIGFFMVFAIVAISYSELSNVASPVMYNATQDSIDSELKNNIVKRESEEAFFTLSGEDKNKNGLRDDPERELAFQYRDKKANGYDSYEKKIKHLLRKMNALTKYEDIASFDYDPTKKYSKSKLKRRYDFLDNYFAIKAFNKCLYEEINDNYDVGSGAQYLQVIRKQLNTKKRRDFFGEDMLFHSPNMFETFTVTKPEGYYSLTLEYSSLHTKLYDPKRIKDYRKASKIKNCEVKEFK